MESRERSQGRPDLRSLRRRRGEPQRKRTCFGLVTREWGVARHPDLLKPIICEEATGMGTRRT
ncbi:MAG TPA: hypothetical protein VKA68_00260, partial [bacterium]|nr:hypothetical protein [bacterium]